MASLKKNIMYNIGYQILSLIVPLVTAPYISRVLGKEGMGLYGYTFSIAHYFVLFCMLGVLNYGNREISRVSNNLKKTSYIFSQIYLNQFLFGILSLIAYFIFVYMYVDKPYRLVYGLQSLYIVSGLMDISWFYFGIEKFKTTTTISAINKILTTVLIFVLVKNTSDVWVYTLILSSGTLLNNIVYWLLLSRYVERVQIDIWQSFSHLKPLLLLFIPVIAVNIYKYIDKIMLGAMLNVGEVGIFEAAEKLTNIPMGFIAAVGTVMLPRISNMVGTNDTSNIKRYNGLSFTLVMFLACGMAFGLAGISDTFVPLFYGEDFTSASIVLVYLCPCMLFVSWANVVRTQYLLPNRKDVIFCVSVVFGAIINVISNIVLVPTFGAIGAAVSTLIAEIVVCVVQSIVAYKDMELLSSLKTSLPFIAVGLVMYLSIIEIQLSSSVATVSVRILVGIILYAILSFYFLNNTVQIKFFKKNGK